MVMSEHYMYLLLYAPVNSNNHVGTLDVERDVKQCIKQTRIPCWNKTQVYVEGFSLMCDVKLPRYGYREADQHLCFRYSESTIPSLSHPYMVAHFYWPNTEMIGILRQLKSTSNEEEKSKTGTQWDMLV